MFKRLFFILLFSFSFSYAKINIAIASNMVYAIEELKKEFNKEFPNIKVLVNIGSSGSLFAQIKNRAPYDIFMSANMKYPDTLYKDNLTLDKTKVYAKGKLSLFTIKNIDLKNIQILKNKDIKKIAIANPKTAPYGKAAFESLNNSKIYKNIKSKLLYAQNISQTITYTIKGADIGLVAKSSLYSPILKRYKYTSKDIEQKLYTPIKQGMVILKNSKNIKEARFFYEFILSKKAKKILKNYGYLVL